MKSNSDKNTQERATVGKRTTKSSSCTLRASKRTAWPGSRLLAMLLVITMVLGMVPGGLFDPDTARAGIVAGSNGLPDIQITGYTLQGENLGNFGTGISAGITGGRASEILFNDPYIWMLPDKTNRLVRVSVRDQSMKGFPFDDDSNYEIVNVMTSVFTDPTGIKTRAGTFASDGNLYVSTFESGTNQLIKVHISDDRNEQEVTKIEGLDVTLTGSYLRMESIGKYLYLLPTTASDIVRYDVETGDVKRYNVGYNGFYGGTHVRESSDNEYKGKLYIAQQNGGNIVCVSLDEYGDIIGSASAINVSSGSIYTSAGVVVNNYLWIFPTYLGPGVINLATNTSTLFNNATLTSLAVVHPMTDGEYIFAAPLNSTSVVAVDGRQFNGSTSQINSISSSYDLKQGSGDMGNINNSSVMSRFHGAAYDDRTNSIWLAPMNADVLVRLQRMDVKTVSVNIVDENGAAINVNGFDLNQVFDYGDMVAIKAPTIPGYQFQNITVENTDDWETVDPGDNEVTVDPVWITGSLLKNKTLVMEYASVDNLTVEMYYDEDDIVPFLSQTMKELSAGEVIDISIPDIPGYVYSSTAMTSDNATDVPYDLPGNGYTVVKATGPQVLKVYFKSLERTLTIEAINQADSRSLGTKQEKVYLNKDTLEYQLSVNSLYVQGYSLISSETTPKLVTVKDDHLEIGGVATTPGNLDAFTVPFGYHMENDVAIEYYENTLNNVVGYHRVKMDVGEYYNLDPDDYLDSSTHPLQWELVSPYSNFTGTVSEDPADNITRYEVAKVTSDIVVTHKYGNETPEVDNSTYTNKQVGSVIPVYAVPKDGYRLMNGGVVEYHTVTDGSNEISFEYEPIQMNELTITVTLEEDGGAPIPGGFSVPILEVVGSITVAAPDIEGYKAVSYVLAEDSTNTVNGTSHTFSRLTSNTEITFKYEKLGKLIVRNYTRTHLETQSLMKEEVFYADHGQPQPVSSYSDVPAGYDLAEITLEDSSGPASHVELQDMVTFDSTKDKILSFYHEEKTGLVTISVTGQMQGASAGDYLYEYEITARSDDAPVPVEAFELTGLKVTKAEVGGIEDTGVDAPQKVTIDPQNGSETVSFTYVDDTVDVTIYSRYYDDQNTDVIPPVTLPSVVKGTQISRTAPSIPGHQLADPNNGAFIGPYTETITVSDLTKSFTFYYLEAEGNQEVIYWDVEKAEEIGRTYYNLPPDNTPVTIPVVTIDDYKTTETDKTATWDGASSIPTITFNYVRDKKTLILEAYDSVTGNPIMDGLDAVTVEIGDLRVLESYDYLPDAEGDLTDWVQQVNADYKLDTIGNPSLHITSYGEDSRDEIVIPIYFTPAANREIEVELWIGKPGDPGSEKFNSYTVPAAPGEYVELTGNQIPKLDTTLRLVYNALDSKTSATQGDGKAIQLVYDDDRYVLKVTVWQDGVEEPAYAETIRTEKNLYDYYPPYLAGHVLVEYDRGSGLTSYTANAIPVTTGTTLAPAELNLYYQNTADYISDRACNLLVIGEDTAGKELYRYTLTGDRGVKDTIYPLDVPNYTPNLAATAGVPVEFGVDSDVTFVYESDLATVTIRAEDRGGTAIAGFLSKSYEVVKGTDFTAYAPVLDGWVIVDTGNLTDYEITQKITSDETFTFTYRRAEGLLLVKAVDENDATNVLKVVGLEKDNDVHIIDASSVLGSITGWDLTDANPSKPVDFPTENEVSFAYGKQLVTITLRGEDVDDPANPKADLYAGLDPSLTSFTRQVGAPFTASMIPLVGYRLVGPELAKTITVPTGGATIQFDYEAVSSNVYVIHEVENTGEILTIHYDDETPGNTYTAKAIQFDGYELTSPADTQQEIVPVDGSELVIRFTYKPSWTTVTVELRDSLWTAAQDGDGLLNSYLERAQINVLTTIYAPPLAGFVLDLDRIENNNGRLDISPVGDPDQDVLTFYYKSIDEASNENYVNITIIGETPATGGSGTALTHYRYVLRLPKSDDPFTLLDGTHVFNVPGYILDANQPHTIVPNQDDTLTFTYTSTEGSVRIVLQDEQGDPVGAGSWSEAATVDDPFTYLAPHVDGYLLVETQPTAPPAADGKSSIGYVDQVAADSSSQIVFTYRPITSPVVIYCYDNDTQDLIRVAAVDNPVVGASTPVAAPDLSAEYYTPVVGTLTYNYNGSDSVVIPAYYDKELATIRIVGVDEDTDEKIAGTEYDLIAQRKGEVITVYAPTTPAQYQRRDAASRLVLVDPTVDPVSDPPQEEIFYFKSVEETSVPVRVVDADTGEELQNYGITATVNEEVKVDPTLIQIAGYTYKADDPNNNSKLTATAGDGSEILVMLTDIRKVLTVNLADEADGSSLGGYVERIVSGTLKTIYPTYVNGYVLIGYKLEASAGTGGSGGAGGGSTALIEIDDQFTGIIDFANSSGFTDDHTVTFVYRQISDYIDGRARSVLVRGLDATSGDPLYSYTVSGDDGSRREIMPIQVPHYTAPTSGETVVFGTDHQVEFAYTSKLTSVRIEAVDENGKALDGYYAKTYDAPIGQDYTAYAPVLEGWVVRDTGNSEDYEITRQITGDVDADTFTFTYMRAEGLVLVKAVEASNPSNILRVVGLPLNDGNHTVDAATTLGDITGWTLTGNTQESITVPADSEVVFTYDQRNVPVTVRYLDQADPTGQTEIRAPQSFTAQEGSQFTASMELVDGWQLAAGEATAKTIFAQDGAEVAFAYVASNANVIVVHKDQESGAVLDIDYLELNAGEGYSVTAIEYTGYQVVTPAVVSGNAPTDGSAAVVEFGYTSLMTDITVLLMSGATLLDSDTVAGQLNVTKTIEAPHVNGYTLNDDAAKTITPTLLGLNTVTFQYRSVDDVSEENRVTITVQGVTTTTASDGSSTTHSHYSYDKKVLRSSDPLTLVNGTDVFAVPGYVLEDGQDSKYTVYPTADQTVTFDYKSTQGTVKITLQEQGTGALVGQGSFYVEATIGAPFTFPAPYVDGYLVAAVNPSGSTGSFTGTIAAVQENTVNEILFEYEQITSQVTIVCKEDDTSGAVIYQAGIPNPVIGGDTVNAPDLSADFYTIVPGFESVTYHFDGTNALVVEAYYTKDLVDLAVQAVDGKTGDVLRTDYLYAQRQGEAVTLEASLVTPSGNYTLIDPPTRIVIAAAGLLESFRYNSMDDSSVMVRVYSGSSQGEEIYNYPIPATTGDTVTIDPTAIRLAGFVLDSSHSDNRYSVTAGDGSDIVVIMTDVRKILTSRFTDEQGGAIAAVTTDKLVAGTLKIIYPTYLGGYVLVGYQLDQGAYQEIDETFTGLDDFANSPGFADDHTVTFVYRQISDYIEGRARSILVRGVDGASGEQLYSYTISGDDGTSRELKPIQVPSYTAADSAKTVVFGRDSQVEFTYVSQLAIATVEAVDENGEAIAGYYPKTYEAVIGDPFTAYAPVIDGWVVQTTNNPEDYEITRQITGTASVDTFTFHYVRSEDVVLVKAVAAADSSNVLRVVGLRLADGAQTVDATALGDITGWRLNDAQTKPITVPDESEVVFAYDQQNVTITVKYVNQADQSEIRPANTFSAQAGSQFTAAVEPVDGWQLAAGETAVKTIYAADQATITFAYEVGSANVVVLHKEQDTGAVLEIGYLELNAGEAYHVSAIDFTGYQVVTPAVVSGTAPSDGSVDVVEFVYESLQAPITVELWDDKESRLVDAYQAAGQRGVSQTLYAPPLAGYVITGAGSESIVPTGDSAQDVVQFYYLSVQDYVDDNFVTITVRGWVENDNTPLYSYTQVRQAGSGPYTIEAMDTVGFVLATGETGQETLEVQEEDLIHTFWYTPLATSVTIKAQLADGSAVPGFADIQAAATINQPFSYNASHIPGYNLTDDTTKYLTPVTADQRTLTFTYAQADGNVVILLKEDDADGAVIKTMSDQLNEGETAIYATTDAAFDLSSSYYYPVDASQSVTVTYDGTAQTVELYYRKALSSLRRAEYDVTTGRNLLGGPTLLADDYRVGELATVAALALSDPATPYELVSTTPQLVIVDSDPDQTVEFEYKSIAGREVVVEAVLAGENGQNTVLQSYTVTSTEGRSVTVPAPSLTGYRLADGQEATGTAAAPGKITFVYVDDRVTVQVSLQDAYGNVLSGPTGYEAAYTVPCGLDHTVYAPHVPGYVITGSQSETYYQIDADQNPIFTYRTVDEESDLNHVDILIRGVTGSYTHYSYVRRFERSDLATALTEGLDLFYVNGYRLVPGQDLSVVPNRDYPEISFTYEQNTALVEIAAVYDDGVYGTPIENFTNIYVEAEIGKPFTFITPDIEGFVATGNSGMLSVVTGDRSQDRITFYYQKGEGNVTVIALEGEAPIGRYQTLLNIGEAVDVARGGALDPDETMIDALQYYEPTTGPGMTDYEVYDGVNPVTVTFQFARKTAPVTLVAMNTAQNDEIDRLSLAGQRVLEEFDFADQLAELDALVELLLPEALRIGASTTHLVSADLDANEILVWYVPPATSAVTVELWIDEPDHGELIQSYYLPATKNGAASLGVSQIPDLTGLGLTYDAAKSTTSAVEGTGEKIQLVYQDRRVAVNVYVVKDGGAPSWRSSQKAVIGTDVLATAPYLSGYVLKQYLISEIGVGPAGPLHELPDEFEGVKITGIGASYDVTFYYQSLDDFVQDEYVNIIVRGLAQGSRDELYSHVVTVPKGDEVVAIEAFAVSGYDLVDDGVELVSADGSQTLVEFLYRNRQTVVTIQALLESGEPVPQFSEVTVAAELGQPFTYNAPYIPGYELVDLQSLTGLIESVSESDNVLAFYYQRATGQVTVLLVEEPDTGGEDDEQITLAYYQEQLVEGTPTTIPVPDLSSQYYVALDEPETVTYTGSAITITYGYEKQTRELVYQIYDVTDPAKEILLEEITASERYRVGEVAGIAAPAYSGFKLISPAVQYVLIEAYGGTAAEPAAMILRQEVVSPAPTLEEPKDTVREDSKLDAAATRDAAQETNASEAEIAAASRSSRSAKRATESVGLMGMASLKVEVADSVGADDDIQTSGEDLDREGTDKEDGDDPDGHGDGAMIDGDADGAREDGADNGTEDADENDASIEADSGTGNDANNDPNNDSDAEGEGADVGQLPNAEPLDEETQDEEQQAEETQDEEPQAVRFEYTSAAENEVVINAVEDDTNKLLYSYTLTGPVGERRTINAPRLAGYALAIGEQQSVVQAISGVVEFRYTQDLVVVTYLLVDENDGIIEVPDWIATAYNVARGADYTAYAPHIPGYALTGQQNQSLANVIDPQEVTFTYRYDGSDQKRPAQVTVHYLKAEDQTTVIKTGNLDGYYVGERFLLLSSLPESFNHGGRKYQLDEALTVIEPTYLLAENDFYAYYKDNGAESTGGGGGGGGGNYTTATLTVHGVDVRTGNLIYNQSVTVVVGTKETIKAPTITGYALDAASESSQTITIESGTNLVTFNYNYTGGEVDLSGGSSTGAGGIVYLSRELLNRTDHYAYISGYPDQTVRPEDSITREEVTAIFYRILTDETRSSYFSQTNRFSDVSYGWWSNDAISTIANLGVVQGDPEGTFRPGDHITRAEMAVIVAKFSGGASTSSGDQFSDISAHWARTYINRAASVGFVNGDGGLGSVFRPDDNMSRAEVMALVNQLLDRIPPTAVNDLDSNMIQWTDNRDAGKWYYYHVQEATNSHYYEVREDGTEKWNGLRSNRSWS